MEPIKPMTMWRGRYGVTPTRWDDADEAVAVVPRAEYDALVAERDALRSAEATERRNHQDDLDFIARSTDWTYSTTAAQPERAIEIVGAINAIMEARDAATARAERAERERDDAHRASMTAAEDFANATGRVSKSNLELRALLKEARVYVAVMREAAIEERESSGMDVGRADLTTSTLLARIDAILDTPTDDSRGDGRDASIHTDTTKPAPKATSADGRTTQKGP